MGKAKTASKNDPTTRGKGAKGKTYKGKPVRPTLYVNGGRKYMAAAYEDNGDLAMDPTTKRPIAWGAL